MRVRARAITTLQRADGIATNFVFRDDTWRDPDGNLGAYHSSHQYRHEYVANTQASDYVLCTRGWGNFSFRLYETLCLGRIPVFVDTDCVLPAADEIDWRSLCVWVPGSELGRPRTRSAPTTRGCRRRRSRSVNNGVGPPGSAS